MPVLERDITERQQKEVGTLVKKLNSAGAFITASVVKNKLRAVSPNSKDIQELRLQLDKIP